VCTIDGDVEATTLQGDTCISTTTGNVDVKKIQAQKVVAKTPLRRLLRPASLIAAVSFCTAT